MSFIILYKFNSSGLSDMSEKQKRETKLKAVLVFKNKSTTFFIIK